MVSYSIHNVCKFVKFRATSIRIVRYHRKVPRCFIRL